MTLRSTPAPSTLNIGLFYDDNAYVEPTALPSGAPGDRPAGLVGRQVAGRSFFEAYLAHGSWSELAVLVKNRAASAVSIAEFCRTHPSKQQDSRRIRIFDEQLFFDDFADVPPARQLYFPCPIDSRHAWARQTLGAGSFALSGVTHTLCTAGTVNQLCEYLTAPFEPYDALICTSSAVAKQVRAITDNYAAYLRDRFGGEPRLDLRLETIPLGVDTDRFHPPNSEERATHRQTFQIADDEIAILFVGRLAHHAKAHPFPMFRAVDLAARASGRKVHLILAGWAPNQAIRDAFFEGAHVFAPSVRVSFVDGMKPATRFSIWKAADLFVSLVDNIQETFGLVVVEAMASGLPIVASDWDGYRDLVDHGQTGFLVPTTIVQGASDSATPRLMFGSINYDHFLAEVTQTVTVDVAKAVEALTRLIIDDGLRQSFGASGRRRALERFAWPRIIHAYEELWREQETIRQEMNASDRDPPIYRVPAHYPPLDVSFQGYPTHWLDPGSNSLLVATSGSTQDLNRILNLPLTNHMADRRVSRPDLLQTLLDLARTPRTVRDLAELLDQADVDPTRAHATLAWMMKYDLLRVMT